MKRLLSILLILAMVGFLVQPIVRASDEENLQIYLVQNTTASATTTAISTSTIIPGKHRILGWTVTPNTSGTGTVNVGLWDAASTGTVSSTNIFGETAVANTTTGEVILPRPKALSSGLVVSLGAYSSAMIYYERSRP